LVVERDPHFRAECQALAEALRGHRTIEALRSSPAWKELGPRLTRVLSTVHRYEPHAEPAPATSSERVLAVQWNIEHGNWYEQVEQALLSHPMLQAADVLFFNEIDFGMARAANRDVTGDLARALGFHACWAPLFLETTVGRDDDAQTAGDGRNQEGLFGVAILSRWPIGEVRIVELPSPERYQFDLERMYGRHIALIATIERPGAPFVAVSTHLEVHRTREDRARQVRATVAALRGVTHPLILAGDFNSHTFDRGRVWDSIAGALVILTWPSRPLLRRLLFPDRGGAREPLFDVLRDADFEWDRYNDRRPTLRLRFSRLDEAQLLLKVFGSSTKRVLGWAERRGRLRLDWFAARGWREGRGATVAGLDGPGKASDHAPIVAEFR
jgi:endonuclease/exonuclease/phosphatase family metal-dependent hydrolase